MTRVLFEKTGPAKYISHLDLNRSMGRVIRRAGISIWYTEGYNPHAFFTFALPLSLGMNGYYETMDFKLIDDEITFEEVKDRLNKCLPDGIVVKEVFEPEMKHTAVAFADFTIYTSIEGCDCEEQFKDWKNYLNQEQIVISKKTKSGKIKEIDLKSHIKEFKLKITENTIRLKMTLPAGCFENINPMLLVDDFQVKNDKRFDFVSVSRDCLYNEDMKKFK